MAAPSSSVDICNLAVGLLKQQAITSIQTPNSNVEVICAKWYDAARRATLEMNPWHFAKKREAVAQAVATPTFGWSYQSAELPSDFIRLCTIGENEDEDGYALEGNLILSNDEGPYYIVYIWDIESVSRFSPTFVIALAHVIASFAAYEITGNASLSDSIIQRAQVHIDRSAAINGQQRPPRRIETSRFNSARRGFYSRRDASRLG